MLYDQFKIGCPIYSVFTDLLGITNFFHYSTLYLLCIFSFKVGFFQPRALRGGLLIDDGCQGWWWGIKHEIAYISRLVHDIDPNPKGGCLYGTIGPSRVASHSGLPLWHFFKKMPKFQKNAKITKKCQNFKKMPKFQKMSKFHRKCQNFKKLQNFKKMCPGLTQPSLT